jgi:hypothetical protein
MGERAYTFFFLAALQYLVGQGVRSAIKKQPQIHGHVAQEPYIRVTWDLLMLRLFSRSHFLVFPRCSIRFFFLSLPLSDLRPPRRG